MFATIPRSTTLNNFIAHRDIANTNQCNVRPHPQNTYGPHRRIPSRGNYGVRHPCPSERRWISRSALIHLLCGMSDPTDFSCGRTVPRNPQMYSDRRALLLSSVLDSHSALRLSALRACTPNWCHASERNQGGSLADLSYEDHVEGQHVLLFRVRTTSLDTKFELTLVLV